MTGPTRLAVRLVELLAPPASRDGQLLRSLPAVLLLRARASRASLLAIALLPAAVLAVAAAVAEMPDGGDLTAATMRADPADGRPWHRGGHAAAGRR